MIREATPADLPVLRAIQSGALAEPWQGLLEPAIAGPPIVLVTFDPQRAGDPATAEPVGYAVAIPEAETAYLAELAVAAGFRRAGRGTALLDALSRRVAGTGCRRLRLTVRVGDDEARAFYDDQGFRVQSLLPHHYETADGLLLTRGVQDLTSN